MKKTFKARSASYRSFVEETFTDWYCRFGDEPQKRLFDAMQYSYMAGGKRLRPIFTFEFCRMCGKDWKIAAPFAAAIEMIQTYSLIHDDLPCMDDDDFRRGKPTNHKVFGEGMAVLAGDALLSDAFTVAASADLPAEDIVFGIQVLSEGIGSLGMVGGQVLDIMSEERACTEQEILDIQSRKTGSLINAACVLGVIAGGGTEDQIRAASQFAACFGLAFQIRDDMLDAIGTAEEMGKGVGTDENKNTFVRLYGLDKCSELVEKYTNVALETLNVFEDHEFLSDLATELIQRRV